MEICLHPKGNRVILLHDRKIIIHPDGTETEEMLKEPQPVKVKLDEISKQSLKESKERMKKELEEDYKLFGVEHNTEIDRECFFYSLVALLLFFGVIGVLIYKGWCA